MDWQRSKEDPPSGKGNPKERILERKKKKDSENTFYLGKTYDIRTEDWL